MGKKKPSTREEGSTAAAGGKSKKKGVVINDDEYSIGTELSEEVNVQDEKVAPVGKQKKGKKGGSKKFELKDDDYEMVDTKVEDEESDEAPVVKSAGKGKGKGKSGSSNAFGASSFGLLGDDDEDEEEEVVAFKGKKKPSKSKKGGNASGSVFSSSAFAALSDEEDEELGKDDEDVPAISFSGKKKPSKSKKAASASLAVLDEEEDNSPKEEEDDLAEITFTGKKKKSSKGSKKSSGGSFSAVAFDGEIDGDVDDVVNDEEDVSQIVFSGKKKSSKKNNSGLENVDSTASSEVIEPDADVSTKKSGEDVPETTSKNKKKKKKGGKAGKEEEEDFDKLLAEFGVAPPVSNPVPAPAPAAAPSVSPPTESVDNQHEQEEKEAEEGPGEPTNAKKKKKKKEKDKKAPASVDEVKPAAKAKVPEKKVPKHVREMQEKIAKQKEEEERRKREEEERIRREEEERLLQEEKERQEEERKRLKKEREKEKILKKKQEGKFLTGKQKEEQRRLEAMRNQILANAGGLPLPTGEPSGARPKKPLYQKKKSKPQAQSNGVSNDMAESSDVNDIQHDVDDENVEEADSSSGKDKSEIADEVEENGIDDQDGEDDDDDEWDAKSWDEADLKIPGISAFADEEVDSEPEPSVKKAVKSSRTAIEDDETQSITTKGVSSSEKVASSVQISSQTSGGKEKNLEVEGADNNSKKVHAKANNKNKKANPVKEETPGGEDGKNLRSPICCIMGHVDTGKTKLLDCIRGTNVQEGEAGGITQQIGATYFPAENIRERTRELKADAKLNVPGLLVIDTPGHESFTNLRSRGSGLCDIAILVVDIMHGLEPQTIESLNLLKMRNTEFIVALNKVDRLYGWKPSKNAPIVKAMKQQSKDVQMEFNTRLTQVITEFKEQGLNTELYYKNKDMGETYSIIPTSAISGEGIPDMLLWLVQWTQKTMIERLTYSNDIQCTVLEVKVVEGHGTTIDVVLVNGVLHEGDQIVVCGLQGPIVTSIRALLTPHPMKELRVKGTYLHHKEIKAAQGIKITAQGLEHAIAGTSLYVVGPDDDLEDIKESAMEDMKSVMSRIDKSGVGVYVQASTLGSLEALLEFLKSPAVSIPVSGISIGPVHKKDVMKASVMLEKHKEYGTILAFDVKVTPEARELAEELGVKIFLADIIYHLFDQFKAYIDNIKEEKKKEASEEAVFPCILKIMPNCVFNKKDPIVLGVDVVEGTAKIGTPICIPQRDFIEIGRISSIENNHKPVEFAKKGSKVAIKIIGSNSDEQQKMFGRHFEIEDELVSKISRSSLDALKEHYAEDLTLEEKRLLFKLKKIFKIP